MNYQIVAKILGILLMVFSITQLTPILVAWIYQDSNATIFFISFCVTLLTGVCLWAPVKNTKRDLRYREGFLVVVSFWGVLAAFGCLPFMLQQEQHISLTDAFFESMSGLTTTGGTIFTDLEQLPQSLLYYRQQLQWLGGMGIIVLAVAIMPMLGVGGMQLYRAETPGPLKDEKLAPRIAEGAKALWYIYLGLTALCIVAYYLAGMTWFDAIAHSFSTVAIGGFSTYNDSIGHFDSSAIETVAMIFMLLASANFSLHFLAWRRRSLKPYSGDSEYRFFIKVLALVAVVVTLGLYQADVFNETTQTLRQGLFHSVSIVTTTGFTAGGYAAWPGALPLILLMASFMGGCAGSTAGGMKVMRLQLMVQQGRKEIIRLVHPNAILSIKLGQHAVSERVINTVTAFFTMYVLSFALSAIALSATGLDWITAFSAAAACLNNLGPGLGQVADNYAAISDAAKWILSFTMLLGRLELFTLLVLFTTTFWRD